MTIRPETLPDDPELLKKLIVQLQSKVHFLEEQFRLARHKQFAASTEASSGQGELFNEVEAENDAPDLSQEETVETEDIRYTRNKGKRAALPKDLPREEVLHDIPDEDKICPCCASALHKIGEERSEQLAFIPAQIKVLEHVRPKYACRQCEKNETTTPIVIAPVPSSPIPKSIATPSLLSQIIVHKYQFALPLYRQEALFKQYGINLNRKTLSRWMIRCAELLEPVLECLKQHLKAQPVIHADETTLKVIQDDKVKSYMWVYCSGRDSPDHGETKHIVLYDYHASRSGACAQSYLQGYTGYLQVDGYAGYEQTEATLVGCMAHARRKFKEAQDAQKNKQSGKAQWALNHIQKLYRIEKKLVNQEAEYRLTYRQEHAKPLMDEFKVWLDNSVRHVAPKTLIGTAVQYCLNQWEKLNRYLEDGELAIDNNRAERAIKPFVIGRKNWLFSNTPSGARASAILYSLIETAKANGLDPNRYLQLLLTEIPKQKENPNLDALMPWAVEI